MKTVRDGGGARDVGEQWGKISKWPGKGPPGGWYSLLWQWYESMVPCYSGHYGPSFVKYHCGKPARPYVPDSSVEMFDLWVGFSNRVAFKKTWNSLPRRSRIGRVFTLKIGIRKKRAVLLTRYRWIFNYFSVENHVENLCISVFWSFCILRLGTKNFISFISMWKFVFGNLDKILIWKDCLQFYI